MRKSVMASAENAFRQQKHVFVCSNNPKGRDKRERADIEDFMMAAMAHSNAREQWFYEALYKKYKGDPADLPWNRS